MKKFLKMCATFTLLGALVVGCIDNTVDDSIKGLRKAKEELIRAEASLRLAYAEVAKAEAAFIMAEIEIVKAEADMIKAKTETIRLENELLMAQNQHEKDSLALELKRLKAEYDVLVETQLAALWAAKENTAAAEAAYNNTLAELQKWLMEEEILRDNESAALLYGVLGDIRTCLGELDKQRTALYKLQVREYFYMNADKKKIEAELTYEIGKKDRDRYYAGLVLDTWGEVLAYADGERHKFLPVLQQKITDARLERVNIQRELAEANVELVSLQKTLNAAQAAYDAAATKVSIAALNGGTDSFFKFSDPANGTPVDRFAQVYNGTFGFFDKEVPAINNAYPPAGNIMPKNATTSRAAINAQLPKVIDLIKKDRLFQGIEGQKQVDEMLIARADEKKNTAKAYTDGLAAWKGYYKAGVEMNANETARLAWTAARASYQALQPQQAAAYKQMNDTYLLIKGAIADYVLTIKGLVAGISSGTWPEAEVELLDLFGKITMNPNELLKLVFQGNYPALRAIYEIAINATKLIADVEIVRAALGSHNALTFYDAAAAWQGSYYKPAIMEKYELSNAFEYHVFFLLYALLEGNHVDIGGILEINKDQYTDAIAKMCVDFIGVDAVEYPGKHIATGGATVRDRVATDANVLNIFPVKDSEKWPVNAMLWAAEKNLYNAWLTWGKIATNLTTKEADLFGVFARQWESTKYNVQQTSGSNWTPTYVYDNPANAIVVEKGKYIPSATPQFYFRPELTMETVHPSLVPGEDTNWGIVADGTNGGDANKGQGYNALYAYRTSLVGVEWSSWLEMGNPVYIGYPVLWQNKLDVNGKGTWDNNSGTDYTTLKLYPKAMVAQRNHLLFEFWNNNQPYYKDLVTELEALYAENAAALAELQAVVDAAQDAVDAQQLIIDGLNDKDGLLVGLIADYDTIIGAINTEFVGFEADYKTAYDNKKNAELAYDQAVANKVMFDSIGVQSTDGIAGFVDNVLDQIAHEKAIVNELIKQYTYELALLESQKAALIKQIGVTLN